MKHIQQGDVCLEFCKIPKSTKKLDTKILRHGESGHFHELVGEAEIREDAGNLYVVVSGDGVKLVHGEHDTIELERGTFKLLPGVFEYDYETEESKRVLD